MPGHIAASECQSVFDELFNTLPWQQETVVDGDETYQQPRLTAWIGEHPYSYSGVTHPPNTEVSRTFRSVAIWYIHGCVTIDTVLFVCCLEQ